MDSSILTRINPKSPKTELGSGGIPELTEEDINHGCGGMPDGPYRLALYKILDRKNEKTYLMHCLSVAGAGDKRIRAWQKKNKGYYHNLCNLAVYEIYQTHFCKPCNGTGMRKKKNKLQTCEFCKGTGYKGINSRDRARKAEIKYKDWHKHKDTYCLLLNILIHWESLLNRRLKRRLR